MADSSGGRKKRGPYKLYNLNPEDECYNPVVPKTTKWRRLQAEEGNLCDDGELLTVGNEDEVNPNSPTLFREDLDANVTDNSFEFSDDHSDSDANDHEEMHGSYAPEKDEDSDLDEPLYDNASVSVGQCLLLIMAFILGNGLTGVAVGNLLKLLTLILPNGSHLPQTKYLFDKYFNVFKDGLQYKLFCPCCKAHLDTGDELKCSICDTDYERQKLLDQGNFFIYLPLEKQLQEFFNSNEHVSSDLAHRFTREKNGDIDDIYDGQMYQSLGDGTLTTDRNAMSISFSCDGVPIFSSSNFSIWPLQGILNELPANKRKQNVFLIALWFGSGKPSIAEFLEPFTDELRKLSTTGMKWLRNGQEVCSKIFACICSCDSVARCALQNIHQFNGSYACSWCYNPGTRVAKRRGYSRVYLETPEEHDLRTHVQMNHDAHTAYRDEETVHGVKGPSKLLELPEFDTVRGFAVDNLHCVDLGVSRQLGHLWFDSVNHQQPWYLGRHITEIDVRLQGISPPHEITRIPRSVTQRAFWKGSEWHWWLLLYCPIILYGLLPSRYFNHVLLLVQGIFLMTKSGITHSEINNAQASLSKFVREFQLLYGDVHMTYNVHQLKHLTQTVIDWGPLSVYSTYIFEGFNQVLLKLFHGTQAVPSQIANSFLLYRALNSITGKSANDSGVSLLVSFMDNQLKGNQPLKKAKRLNDQTVLLGASYYRELSIEEQYLVENHDWSVPVNSDFNKAEFFTKVIIGGNVVHCQQYTRSSLRKNSIVGLVDGTTVELIVFVLVGDCCFAFAKLLYLEQPAWLPREHDCGRLCNHVKKVTGIEPALQVVELNTISDKYAAIHSVSKNCATYPDTFVCKLPNIMDRD